ncbi:MAG TPA: histidine ammonia-lyase [Dinghuibacter sp.]|uniref:histidine ammonia-lyase n=1 Tax=Dinghuibacter sp. TaxID=2024697 RepID=UPI002C1F8BFA|nr:histidine ammonia-lyase [Dinghuibacter sp.]HTJ10635.1 histidine ammonia-lyase [Dinghuibacter sp.]
MSYNYLPLDEGWLGFDQVRWLLEYGQRISITFGAHERILKCREYLDGLNGGRLYYGINTGFGFLQNIKIDDSQTQELQYNLLKSHACGLGSPVPEEIVRLMLVFKIKSLSYGHSGVQIDTVKRLLDFYNQDVLPVVYTQGSLGASGDLAPLSHLCLPLIGLGEVTVDGEKRKTNDLAWEPIKLRSKEGLALINGTQFMTAYGMYILTRAYDLLAWADKIAAMSWDAFDCSPEPLNARIHEIRPHKGQIDTAATLRDFLDGSAIAGKKKSQVQDPYSFRCIPQVHGATKGVFEHVKDVFLTEINSVTDNPNIFPDEDLILSGGNFHGQPLAMALDYLAISLAEIGSISERRVFQLLSGQRGLPLFLVKDPGLHSGFMIPQYTAAGIVSENKQLCTPASVDSITSSNGQEDHVSMGANAATKCLRVLENVEKVLAIELMSAAQALEFRRPARTSEMLEALHEEFREKVPFNEADRVLHDDMTAAIAFLRGPAAKKEGKRHSPYTATA